MTIRERYPHLTDVEGWLTDEDVRFTDDLLTYQRSRGFTGDVLEIGIYHGRYFIVLAKNLAPDETILGIDIFHSKPPTITGSANSDRDSCILSLKKYLPDIWGTGRLVVLEEDSIDFAASDYVKTIEGTFRFISIDGGHDADTVFSDLLLAERLLMRGGLITLDDYHATSDWVGVIEGWENYCSWAEEQKKEPRLREVAQLDKKLLLGNDEAWTSDYRKILVDRLVVA